MTGSTQLKNEPLVLAGMPETGMHGIADFFALLGVPVKLLDNKPLLFKPGMVFPAYAAGKNAERAYERNVVSIQYAAEATSEKNTLLLYCDPWDYMRYACDHHQVTAEQALQQWLVYHKNIVEKVKGSKQLLVSSYAFLQQPIRFFSLLSREFGFGFDPEMIKSRLNTFHRASNYTNNLSLDWVLLCRKNREIVQLLEDLHSLSQLPHDQVSAVPAGSPAQIDIVIPCYNIGHLLPEAIASIERSLHGGFNLFIVNDGSTHPDTLDALRMLESKGYSIVHQGNQGLCRTLNNGIAMGSAPYVLVLSADDKLDPRFLHAASDILRSDKHTGVVYTNPKTFEARYDMPDIPDFEPVRFLTDNFIVATALYKRELWEKAGGYDSNIDGYEDWGMWVSCMAQGAGFHHLDEYLFHYRIRMGSKITTLGAPADRSRLTQYICAKYPEVYNRYLPQIIGKLQFALADHAYALQEERHNLGVLDNGRRSLGIIGKVLYKVLKIAGTHK